MPSLLDLFYAELLAEAEREAEEPSPDERSAKPNLDQALRELIAAFPRVPRRAVSR